MCCTGTGLLVEEQKMAETVLAELIIPEIHWHWVVPAYLPLEVFIFEKGSGMVSCLAKRARYQLYTARGNHFRTVVCLDSLDSLDMFIGGTGIRLLVEEQKMAETVVADLISTEIHWHWVVPAYLPLEVFIFGKGSGMVSCLAKHVKYQLLQGDTILDHLHA